MKLGIVIRGADFYIFMLKWCGIGAVIFRRKSANTKSQ